HEQRPIQNRQARCPVDQALAHPAPGGAVPAGNGVHVSPARRLQITGRDQVVLVNRETEDDPSYSGIKRAPRVPVPARDAVGWHSTYLCKRATRNQLAVVDREARHAAPVVDTGSDRFPVRPVPTRDAPYGCCAARCELPTREYISVVDRQRIDRSVEA